MRNEIIDLVDNAKSGESENQKVEDSADSEIRNTTRPRNFDDFVGQDDIITHLSIMIEAAKTSSRPLDHVLFAISNLIVSSSIDLIVPYRPPLVMISSPLFNVSIKVLWRKALRF